MPVDSQHTEYSDNLSKWQLVRDCDSGAEKVKEKGKKYLPMPNPTDESEGNIARYKDYKNRANFVNFTSFTKEGMLGMVFRKETKLELAPDIDYLIENVNGDGLTADQAIKDATSDTMLTGRYGLLVDYPQADEGLTQAQVQAMNLRANIKQYRAENIINWRTTTVGGLNLLSLVVLLEPTEVVLDDGYETVNLDYHRVLVLEDGYYKQKLYDEDNQLVAEFEPRKSNGSRWDIIPFQFVGALNNDSAVDKAPLYDIAEINIAHYRNNADFEESSFMVGQPTPVFSGLTQSWVDQNMKDGVALGSRGGVLLPENGNGQLLQADPNQMPEKGMERKEQQMIMIGARLIQDQGGVETAQAAVIRFGGQNSKIGSLIKNVESAFEKCFIWAMEFMGGTQDPEIEINKELYDKTIDPQMIMALIQLGDRGIIAENDIRDNVRKHGIIEETRTNEEIEAEAEAASPMGGLDVNDSISS